MKTLQKRGRQFLSAILIFFIAPAATADGGVTIVGSSTVYPFSTTAAERFSQITGRAAPLVESTGSGGGLKLFCGGDGAPDIANASRRMEKSEQRHCRKNGVLNILEVKIGYDGIVVAHDISAVPMSVSRRELFLALARQIPDNGVLIDNPNKQWRDISAALPPLDILVYGPPPTSGTRDAFAELVLEKGCVEFASLKKLRETNKQKFRAVCHALREDGVYVEAGENDNLIIQKLLSNRDSVGIFGFSFLDENRDKVRALPIENVSPEFETIADGSYSVSRPLFFYVKTDNYDSVDDLADFAAFFASAEVMGEDGFLSARGLIPLPPDEYKEVHGVVANKKTMADL